MKRQYVNASFIVLAVLPFAILSAQQQTSPQTCEQVFKNIKVLNGVPATDLIPAMEFMSASLKFECKDCHDPNDYSKDTEKKEESRKMILMQREINKNHFNNKLEVTCMSCHNGHEKPTPVPVPEGVKLRHERLENPPKLVDVMSKHIAAVGDEPAMIVRTGTLTSKNEETGKSETLPLEFVQAQEGKYRLVSGSHTVVSDGKQSVYGGNALWGEPVAIFERIGRAYRGEFAFMGLQGAGVSGKDKVGEAEVVVVQGFRPGTDSIEELHFDTKTGLLLRLVNIRRSSLGTCVSMVDYSDYKKSGGTNVPNKVTVTFTGGEKWEMAFTGSKVLGTIDEAMFKIASPTPARTPAG